MKKPPLRELLELALLAALMIAGKEALRVIPNVHPVTVLLLLAVILYGADALLAVFVFIGVEILLYGFGIWNVMYLIAWPVLILLVLPFRKRRSRVLWAFLAALHGLLFGALCAIPYIVTSGVPAAVAYWIAGIPFDVVHCVSNFVLTWFLLPPLLKAAQRSR